MRDDSAVCIAQHTGYSLVNLLKRVSLHVSSLAVGSSFTTGSKCSQESVWN